MNDTPTPNFCPKCGKSGLRYMTDWTAESNEPCDKGNVAKLEEYQCEDEECATAFWV